MPKHIIKEAKPVRKKEAGDEPKILGEVEDLEDEAAYNMRKIHKNKHHRLISLFKKNIEDS